jgi:hypothetical protein
LIFDDPTLSRLLGSIEANRLMLLCGAGLSMAPPSNLMSAVRVSNACYDKYEPTRVLPVALRGDIDALAAHFHATNEFKGLFIGSLVPWNDLVGVPNPGHAAVADLLISRAARAALSANFDVLIEQWAMSHKIALQGALNGHEATEFAALSGPLVKFHGCLMRNQPETLWTRAQLAEPTIADRVATCSNWMRLQLPGKDLLVVGFWTDWGYLNDVVADALDAGAFTSVTVIDPADSAALKAKAPTLWARLTGGTAYFQHLRASGADALAELRTAFSKVWMRKFFALGKALVEAEGRTYSAIDPAMTGDDLYDCRRDAEGVPYSRAAQSKEPPPQGAQASFFHHLLVTAGATRAGSSYEYEGKRIRIVQGAGQALHVVRERYIEPPGSPQPDIVVCAGSLAPAVKGKLISSGTTASIVRPAGGGVAHWMTLEEARGELAL